MSKFERKFGKYAIPNLPMVIIACYMIGLILYFFAGDTVINWLTLDPYLILRGQVWRLITWILIPYSASSILGILIMLLFYYSIGNNLNHMWGPYRFNMYYFSGMLFTVIGSFVILGILYLQVLNLYGNNPAIVQLVLASNSAIMAKAFISTFYINTSLFLAYATMFQEARVLLFFIIPVKVKWMGIIYAAFLGFQIIMDIINKNFYEPIIIICSLLNFLVFFLTGRKKRYGSPKMQFERARARRDFQREVKQANPEGITKHKCAICGRTENDGADLEFRFCTKCNGNYEYCKEHLFTHTHVE